MASHIFDGFVKKKKNIPEVIHRNTTVYSRETTYKKFKNPKSYTKTTIQRVTQLGNTTTLPLTDNSRKSRHTRGSDILRKRSEKNSRQLVIESALRMKANF